MHPGLGYCGHLSTGVRKICFSVGFLFYASKGTERRQRSCLAAKTGDDGKSGRVPDFVSHPVAAARKVPELVRRPVPVSLLIDSLLDKLFENCSTSQAALLKQQAMFTPEYGAVVTPSLMVLGSDPPISLSIGAKRLRLQSCELSEGWPHMM
jgi:hypothetical protein